MSESRLDLSVLRRREGGVEKLILIGDADLGTVPKARAALRSLIDDATTAASIDMSLLGALDPCILGDLLGARMRAIDKGVSLTIVCDDERVLAWLNSSGILELIPYSGP